MWVYVLFITVTFISPIDKLPHEQSKALSVFSTIEECLTDMKDLAQKLADSYPGETDYTLSCEKRQKLDPVTKQPLIES